LVIKSFLALVLLYLFMFGLIATDLFFYPAKEHRSKLSAFSKQVTLPFRSTASTYLQTSLYVYEQNSLSAYPQMPPIDPLDFVYAK